MFWVYDPDHPSTSCQPGRTVATPTHFNHRSSQWASWGNVFANCSSTKTIPHSQSFKASGWLVLFWHAREYIYIMVNWDHHPTYGHTKCLKPLVSWVSFLRLSNHNKSKLAWSTGVGCGYMKHLHFMSLPTEHLVIPRPTPMFNSHFCRHNAHTHHPFLRQMLAKSTCGSFSFQAKCWEIQSVAPNSWRTMHRAIIPNSSLHLLLDSSKNKLHYITHVNVCMYLSIYLCMHACMYIRTYVRMYVCMCVWYVLM